MMKTDSQIVPIVLSLTAAFNGAFANWFYKTGANKMDELVWYKNWFIPAGVVSFISVLVLFIFAFKVGGRLFVVYPVYATTYIWVGLLGVYLDKEPWTMWQVTGVGLIILGVSLIAGGYPK